MTMTAVDAFIAVGAILVLLAMVLVLRRNARDYRKQP
jgi:hypothetical protein